MTTSKRLTSLRIAAGLVIAGGAAAAVSAQSCAGDSPSVVAKQIQSRAELIGGPGALGEVGDYLLANEQIRVIVQGAGFSRGFGLYGGSLIDADLQRPQTFGSSAGGQGNDNFSELFPGLFLKAMRPRNITVNQGEDGSAAVIVTGSAAEFIFMASNVNDVLLDGEKLSFRNEYRLHPGKRYVKITTTVSNISDSQVKLPSDAVSSLLGDARFELPVGDVILFGAGNEVFAEGAGFDMRFTLEDLYKAPVALPQLPGLVTPFLATKGPGVSYGFMSGITDPELSLITRAGYEGKGVSEMVVPFYAGGFTGAYYGAAPRLLEPRGSRDGASSFSFSKYFIVGGGDVASVRDVVHELRGEATGRFAGVVRERLTQAPEADVDVVTYDAEGRPFNQHTTDDNGYFGGTYPPGRYSYRVHADGRFPTRHVYFEVQEGQQTAAEIELDSPGLVNVRVIGEDGRPLPSRCTLVATYPAAATGFEPRDFLYDLKLGERMRPVDLVPDTADPMTRRYVEEIILAPQGRATQPVRPGRYTAVCSRGMEYDIAEQVIEVRPGELASIDVSLKRVVDTAGWASGDFHLHSIQSVDSFIGLEERVAHVAAEGVDIACSSDHNFVTDYTRAIAGQNLDPWLQGMVGLELTTLEIGHFNGFPLRYDPGPITKGSFEWSGRPPQRLFDELRGLGAHGPENVVIQVNHPRDTILGYFNGYNFNPDTGEPEESDNILLAPDGPEFGPENFSWDFDALEIYNGKRYDLLRHYRVPEVLPPPPLPADIPPAGTVLRDRSGKIAYPGALEDWFTLLNQGRVFTAMGNSDTHGMEDEPGIPRTYLPVSDDRPGAIDELEVVAAIKSQRAFPTNGPFSTIGVTGDGGCFDRKRGVRIEGKTACGMGEVAVATGGRVTVRVDTQVAPWVKINRVSFVVNGDTVATVRGDNESLQTVTQDLEVPRDSWLLVEVAGDESMFPVILPRELPSIQVSDAIGSVAGAFGFDFSPFGNLRPSEVTITYPYAFTNPVFVDTSGDGVFNPPGLSRRALTADTAPRCSAEKPDLRGVPALAKIFALFNCGHGHGH